ncbi:hypothetical protein BU15DRAFT_83893 [Melanogaster broomeanus]|nr:hypothetical protein BU15DRAFT_83893 [Melanogaster broomeanus]
MTSGLFQDAAVSSPSTSSNPQRFRPYASPNHQVTKGRYITSNDPRGYIPVYEYPLNGQWIMMDIDDGYILWTGIWKALGNSKADIVKMIDSQPDLAPVIRRVRGGYLKIQGTWMPYEVALRLSRRVAWPIRDDLVPLFGPTFPSTCLSPDQAGYGQVVSNATGRRRARRTNQSATPVPTGTQPQATWSSTIPVMPGPGTYASSSAPYHHSDPRATVSYNEGYAYPSHPQIPQHLDKRVSPPPQRGYVTSPSSSSPLVRERSVRSRYSPYPGPATAPPRKSSASTSESLSLDIPSISLHDPAAHLSRPSSRLPGDLIKLPPIQPLAPPRHVSHSSYALPPISALEDLRGISSQDSAAVLERLKMDDDRRADAHNDGHWARQRSVSTSVLRPTQAYTTSSSWSGPSSQSGSFSNHPFRGRGKFEPTSPEFSPTLQSCHEGSSIGGLSPVSPLTPRSTDVPTLKARGIELGSREHDRRLDAPLFATTQVPSPHAYHDHPDRKNGSALSSVTDTRRSTFRHSGDSDDSEYESSKRPIRPW